MAVAAYLREEDYPFRQHLARERQCSIPDRVPIYIQLLERTTHVRRLRKAFVLTTLARALFEAGLRQRQAVHGRPARVQGTTTGAGYGLPEAMGEGIGMSALSDRLVDGVLPSFSSDYPSRSALRFCCSQLALNGSFAHHAA